MSNRARMMWSLEGLALGDAFGFRLLVRPVMRVERRLPEGPWRWSDDAHMAMSVVEILQEYGEVDPQALLDRFARRYGEDPDRGYGSGMRRLLSSVGEKPWAQAAQDLFWGNGSFGNGAAMRVAPLGAYFADDLARVVDQARLQARVTHAHPEGIAGSIAVALAAAVAVREPDLRGVDYLEYLLERVPESEVRRGMQAACAIEAGAYARAAEELGTGFEITAQDTVPFCLWVVSQHLDDYEQALWHTVDAGNDADTTCAIVGGIIAARSQALPQRWMELREPLELAQVAAGG